MSDDDILEIARECMTQRQLNYTEALQFARAIEAEVKNECADICYAIGNDKHKLCKSKTYNGNGLILLDQHAIGQSAAANLCGDAILKIKKTKQYNLEYANPMSPFGDGLQRGNSLHLIMFCSKRMVSYTNFFKLDVSRDELAKSIKRGRKLIRSHDFFQTDKKKEKLKPKDFAKK